MKPIVTVIITRASIGGAQKYVLSTIEELKDQFHFNVIVGSHDFLSQALEKENINTTVIPALNSANIIKAVWQIRTELKRQQPALINTHSTLASIYARLANIRLKIPLIYSVHGWFFSENTSIIRQKFGPYLERAMCKLTTHWITETRFDQALGLTHSAIASKTRSTVIANGIPQPEFKKTAIYQQNEQTINIVFVGRISYQKNPTLALKVLHALPEQYRLTLFCDNKDDKELLETVFQLKLGNRIDIIDDEKQTSSILHHFDLLLMTSRYEGMPLCVIEAMASGLPVVSSNTCGLNELVHDGKNGFLISGDDANEYANKITSIFSNTNTRSSMSETSKSLYENHHTVSVMSQKIAHTFKNTINAN